MTRAMLGPAPMVRAQHAESTDTAHEQSWQGAPVGATDPAASAFALLSSPSPEPPPSMTDLCGLVGPAPLTPAPCLSGPSRAEGVGAQSGSSLVNSRRVPGVALVGQLSGGKPDHGPAERPAGAGKTTLLKQWAVSFRRPLQKLRLGAHLDDRAVLAQSVASAMGAIRARQPMARTAITRRESTTSSVVLLGLAVHAAIRATPYVQVLDDLHLARDPDCVRLVRMLADAVPRGSVLAWHRYGASGPTSTSRGPDTPDVRRPAPDVGGAGVSRLRRGPRRGGRRAAAAPSPRPRFRA